MSARWKVLLIALMSLALMFGYLKRLLPGWQLHDFERLHIFLFNMVAGGTILLHYSERRAGRRDKRFSRRVTAYLVLGTADSAWPCGAWGCRSTSIATSSRWRSSCRWR